jgi:hypothetical protein
MINVEEMSLAEFFRLQKSGAEVVPYIGGTIKGFVDAVCRDADSGDVAWEIHQPNVFTDFGRRHWVNTFLNTNIGIFTSGHSETPRIDRYSLHESYGGTIVAQKQPDAAGSADWGTCSKYWSYTFGTPASIRPLACVGLASASAYVGSSGIARVLAYSLLTPAKTQSTNQTLEISYRLTMTPTV